MFGNNPKRGYEKSDGSKLAIYKIFSTIQGECINAGEPAIFVRLSGCNLACSFCDTEFEEFNYLELKEIIADIEAKSLNSSGKRVRDLVVITGGEPFRQNIKPLCDKLLTKNFKVQIETNGTIFQELSKDVEIICSPKATSRGYNLIREDLLQRINAFKFVISKNNEIYNFVPELGQALNDIPVFIQPMDEYDCEKNKENINYALELCNNYGYRLSMQLHKILGIE